MPAKQPAGSAPRHWLVKSEPESFSWDDLWRAPKRTTSWDGVRNYQARNLLRDEMKKGDLVFFYHSSTDPSAIVGVCEVAREGYPDATQFDSKSDYFDAGSDPAEPRWYVVDLKAVEPLPRPMTLKELRGTRGLEDMVLLRKGSRLSVQPVSAKEWSVVLQAARKPA
jgi:predicted RNA-binding protein with PUA-like domain